MPANDFDFIDWLSMKSLQLLTNTLEIGTAFNTDYNSEFTKEFAVGEVVRVPFPKWFTPNTDNTLGYTPQPIIDRATSVTIDKVAKVHFEWDSIEKALKMPRGRDRIAEQILKPAMAVIKQQYDSACALWAYQNTPNIAGILGTNPTTFDAVYGAAGQRMTELAASPGDRKMFLPPSVTRALRASAVAQFNPASEISKQWRTGSIGVANGFDTYESMSLYRHTAGTWAGTVEMLAAGQSGASLSLTATTGDTFKKGDVFSIAGVEEMNPATVRSTGAAKQFVVLADVTAAASAATVSVYPAIVGPGSPYQNVSALPAAGADLTLFPGTSSPNGKVGTQGLALGDNAFALVSVPLSNPTEGAEMVSQARDPKTGISVAFIRAFDYQQRKWINRFDSIFGFGNLYADHAAVRILSA